MNNPVIILLITFWVNISLAQEISHLYPRCIEITRFVKQNIDSLEEDSLKSFFNQFSLVENINNVEFNEWGNKVLFEVLRKKPNMFFTTLFKMNFDQIKSIENQINHPIHDGINMIKLYNNVKNSSLDELTKYKALKMLQPSYDALKKMIEDWESKNNKKWED